VTYNLHIIIRFELEKAIINGDVAIESLPRLWNEKYKEYLGVTPPTDSDGVLQDIHWSHGSFGYFPTYSLGSFYAAQYFAAAGNQIGDITQQIENGNSHNLLSWLRENIHRHGRKYTSEELCKRITGKTLDTADFMSYLLQKYTMIYNL